MPRTTSLLFALIAPVAVFAQQTAAPTRTLDLQAGATFAYRMSNETTMSIDMRGSKLLVESSLQEDLDFTVSEILEDGNYLITVRYARIQGRLRMPMQPETEFDSDREQPSFDDDPMTAAMVFLAGLQTDVVVSRLGKVVEIRDWDETFGAHTDRMLATTSSQMKSMMRDTMLESITAQDIKARVELDLQRFPAEAGTAAWPLRLLVPGQDNDRQMVLVGEHQLRPVVTGEGAGPLTVAHEGTLELLDPEQAGLEVTVEIEESSVTGQTTLAEGTGLIIERELKATATMSLGDGAEQADMEQAMTFRVAPVELSAKTAPAEEEGDGGNEDEDDPFK